MNPIDDSELKEALERARKGLSSESRDRLIRQGRSFYYRSGETKQEQKERTGEIPVE